MKKLLLIILFFVSWTAAKAQDKIITIKQDTIECRILSVNAERINYEQISSDQQLVGSSISTSDVFKYFRKGKYDLFKRSTRYKARRKLPMNRWLFSLHGGLAYSFTDYSDFESFTFNAGNSTSVIDDYIRKLKNGVHINSSLHYLLNPYVGLGVDYNLFYSASKGEFWSQANGASNIPVYIKVGLHERLYANFAGASFLFQQFADQKKRIKISETISPGIVMFRNEIRINQLQNHVEVNDYYNRQSPQYYEQTNSLITSTPFGAKGSLSVDYSITPKLSAGLAGSFMWAKLHKLSTKDQTTESKVEELGIPINISHIDYGFIVRYNF